MTDGPVHIAADIEIKVHDQLFGIVVIVLPAPVIRDKSQRDDIRNLRQPVKNIVYRLVGLAGNHHLFAAMHQLGDNFGNNLGFAGSGRSLQQKNPVGLHGFPDRLLLFFIKKSVQIPVPFFPGNG